jgi:hypothetical protein
VSHCPFAEACWYFPITREQYRVSGEHSEKDRRSAPLTCFLPGRLRVVDHACEESALREARNGCCVGSELRLTHSRTHLRLACAPGNECPRAGAPSLRGPTLASRVWRVTAPWQRQTVLQPRTLCVPSHSCLQLLTLAVFQAPLPAFCLVVMTVEVVDWLSLKSNRRCAYERAGEGGQEWVMTELNP